MHEKDKAKRLYIVRVEFEFPAMLTEKEAAMEGYIGHLYRPPHGYDLEPDALVYGTRDDLAWSDAVEIDKSAAKAD